VLSLVLWMASLNAELVPGRSQLNRDVVNPVVRPNAPSPCPFPVQLPRQSIQQPIAELGAPNCLYQTARAITVKVKVGRNSGSGVLLRQQGTLYTVITNRHVINAAAPYVIQTPDGRSHPGYLVKKIDFRGNDLAMLQFRSKTKYAIAKLGHAKSLLPGSDVFAAGFPHDSVPATKQGFLLTTGSISLIPSQAFVGGYQLGYTNRIYQGMSGGPVLNAEGALVGLNSLHAYPLWGDPYIFQDGSKPDPLTRSLIVRSSWAIPIEKLTDYQIR
jgi:S1-C subfamily serine protease